MKTPAGLTAEEIDDFFDYGDGNDPGKAVTYLEDDMVTWLMLNHDSN